MSARTEAFSFLPPPAPAVRATVAIPAHDEAACIERALVAIAGQRDLDGSPLDPRRFDVLVYANDCSDDTAEIARAVARRYPAQRIFVVEDCLPEDAARIGEARGAVMDAAAARFGAAHPNAIVATSDADTVVAPTWLANTVLAMRGVDAVGGRILVDPGELAELPAHTQRMLAEENAYQFALTQLRSQLEPEAHDPWPRHWQHFGPSLAVRVAAYGRAGGIPRVRALEDVAFVRSLERTGARVRHSLRVRVTTSARLQPRVRGGFGSRLGEWNAGREAHPQLLVEHPSETLRRLRGRPVSAGPRLPRVPAPYATALLRRSIASRTQSQGLSGPA